MKNLLLALLFLTTNVCIGQTEAELFQQGLDAYNEMNYVQSRDLIEKAIETAPENKLANYHYNKAWAEYELHEYEAAMAGITEALDRGFDSCKVSYLHGQLKFKLNNRAGACAVWRACPGDFGQLIEYHCNPNWDYEKALKVHYLDTTLMEYYISAYYVGCKEKVVDTMYTLRYEYSKRKSNWEIYYDEDFTQKMADFFIRNDTSFTIRYYENGQRKSENREVDYHWIYEAKWCENGQMTFGGKPGSQNYSTATVYHCNGNKSWEGNLWRGQIWGTETRWYENGQKQSVKKHTEFNQELAENGWLTSEFISGRFWDETGKEVEAFQDEVRNINTLGAPISIAAEELKEATPYYNIVEQEAYDNKMHLFSEKVYRTAKIKASSKCKCGLVYVSFLVTKEGTIENIKLDIGLDETADAAFVKAIKKIKKWPPGKVNGEPVDVYVVVALELEKVKG